MNVHKNARLTPAGRAELVRAVLEGERVSVVAASFRTTPKTVRKWVRRYLSEGEAGLADRSSCPSSQPSRTSQELVDRIVALRRDHRLFQHEVAEQVGVPVSTVGRWLRREGLGRLPRPDADEPVRRYERQAAGELVHLDIKKLARFDEVGHRITGSRRGQKKRHVGYDSVHVAIDDYSRVAYVEVLPNEQATTTVGFLRRATAWFRRHGVHIERVMTDNGPAYKSRLFAAELEGMGARHIFTRPFTPKTNGKAERFIGTLVREWAYKRPYPNSQTRNQVLPCFVRYYNQRRSHSAVGRSPPVTRLPPIRDNLMSVHS